MKKKLSKKKYYRRKRIKRFFRLLLLTGITVAVFLGAIYGINEWIGKRYNIMDRYEESEFILDGVKLPNKTVIQADLLSQNPYSRPGTKLKRMNGIVIHYVGNPNTSAKNNRNYFEGLAKKKTTSASSHFVVGLEGEIIQCVPLNEVAYCSNDRNNDTISIEVCHPDQEGKFNKKTYRSVVELTAYLCNMFELKETDVIRHFDVTKKRCPLYYVEHEDAWEQLRTDVTESIEKIKKKEKKQVEKQ